MVDAGWLRFAGFVISGPVNLRDAHHVEIDGNDLPGERIWLEDTDHARVEQNYIHDIPASASGKIGIRLIDDSNAVLRGNRIENLVEDPIQTTSTANVLIEGNVLVDAHPERASTPTRSRRWARTGS